MCVCVCVCVCVYQPTCPEGTPPGDNGKNKALAIDGGVLDAHKAVDKRDYKLSQLGADHELPQYMSIPDKPLVRLLIQGELCIGGCGLLVLVSALPGVSEVVAAAVVEARSVQHTPHHGQQHLVLSVLHGGQHSREGW